MSVQAEVAGAGDARLTRGRIALTAVLLFAFGVVLVRTAWVCDDAYITLRTCHNLTHGFGPVYNVGERVESYSNPLWMLIVSALYLVTGEGYFTLLGLSFAASLAAVLVACRPLASDSLASAQTVVLLALSKAFVDYSTSGLENPLSHLLLALFAATFLSPRAPDRPQRLALLAGLAAINRLDDLVLYVFPLLFVLARAPSRATLVKLGRGLAPLVLWKLFALYYYGFPFPNTAYAKVFGTGIGRLDRIEQGLRYLVDSFQRDPLSLVSVVAAVGLGLAARGRLLPLALALVAKTAYVVWVGGDFMSGRFLSSAVLLAAVVIAASTERLPAAVRGALLVATAVVGFASPRPTVLSGSDYRSDIAVIADERGVYYGWAGLLSPEREVDQYRVMGEGSAGPPVRFGPRGAKGPDDDLRIKYAHIGFPYYQLGPETHAIDGLGLTDPLLARLPGIDEQDQRPGHVRRYLPEEYALSLLRGENLLRDPGLREYYDVLSLVTRGSLLDARRLGAIWSVNLGRGRRLLREYVASSYGRPTRVALADVSAPRAAGTPWHADGVTRFGLQGLVLDCGGTITGMSLELTLDAGERYRVAFLVEGEERVSKTLVQRYVREERGHGLVLYALPIPRAVRESGFDAIRVEGGGPDGVFALGHARVVP